MTSAANQVLCDDFLLEAILLRIPPRDVLINSLRVDKAFNRAVTTSPSLQRALFFLPKMAHDPNCIIDNNIKNHLLDTMFVPWFRNKGNPPGEFEVWRDVHFFKYVESSDRFLRAEASWRRMLVSQPPIKHIFIAKGHDTVTGYSEMVGSLHIEDGLRMGMLYDITESHTFDYSPVNRFKIMWNILAPSDDWDSDCEYKHLVHIWRYYDVHPDMTIFLNTRNTDKIDRPHTDKGRYRSHGYQPVEISFRRMRRNGAIRYENKENV